MILAKQRGQNKKAAQSPQVWAAFDITAKTYFVPQFHFTIFLQNSKC
jgi:hypothetical protein